jgi:hypothetical protein
MLLKKHAVKYKTHGLDIAMRWPDAGPKILLTQAVQLFNGRGNLGSIRKAGRHIAADQAMADKHVVEALPPRRGPRQGTKRRQAQVVASDDAVEAQILGEIEAI